MIYHQTFLKVSILAGSSAGYVNSVGTFAKFYQPTGIATNEGGNLLIADFYNNVIRRIDISSSVVTTLAGSTAGSADGPGTYAQFSYPIALTVGLRDYIYVIANSNTRLRLIEGYATPTVIPSNLPTTSPIVSQVSPTVTPTNVPTAVPTQSPTNNPTFSPTYGPIGVPTDMNQLLHQLQHQVKRLLETQLAVQPLRQRVNLPQVELSDIF